MGHCSSSCYPHCTGFTVILSKQLHQDSFNGTTWIVLESTHTKTGPKILVSVIPPAQPSLLWHRLWNLILKGNGVIFYSPCHTIKRSIGWAGADGFGMTRTKIYRPLLVWLCSYYIYIKLKPRILTTRDKLTT